MIKGLYETHLPVSNLARSVEFYKHLGLELAYDAGNAVFFWIEKEKSWLGLWEGEEYKTPYHPSLRHFAFRVSYEDIKRSLDWMREKGIEPQPFGRRNSVDPFVRPYQGNASVYFADPDGNSLELMCFVEVPESLRSVKEMLSIPEWEALLERELAKEGR